MASRLFQALALTTWLYSLLLWLYVVARVAVSGVDVRWPFIDRIPYISITEVGAASYSLSFMSLLVYL